MFDEEEKSNKSSHISVGDNLERFSLTELAARLLALEEEIKRTKAEMIKKEKINQAADNFFKKI